VLHSEGSSRYSRNTVCGDGGDYDGDDDAEQACHTNTLVPVYTRCSFEDGL